MLELTGIDLIYVRGLQWIVQLSFTTSVTVEKVGLPKILQISLQAYDYHGFVTNLDKPTRSLDFYSLSNEDTIYAMVV